MLTVISLSLLSRYFWKLSVSYRVLSSHLAPSPHLLLLFPSFLTSPSLPHHMVDRVSLERWAQNSSCLPSWGSQRPCHGLEGPTWFGFPGGSVVKNPLSNSGDTRDPGSIPGLGRSPGVGNANPLQKVSHHSVSRLASASLLDGWLPREQIEQQWLLQSRPVIHQMLLCCILLVKASHKGRETLSTSCCEE